ncbi:hypothetical protein SAICODRAFT_28367 [Saitoella complicata NRRL Y-17804]|uniref:DASH complex subunit DAM1 n=1 Tax=Saitoella complicata (strain BCRC 22490 / CBS 7301 / JCM 7358 / NBRC 10748 / NRRL Y-17804) TaxID=698492 RepID=A0A0E9NHT0_SAICN|nr:uncharacterized protein SAICODRAFT_28367 [Saitoella complicata NRRL Y-17804]ODQ56077.1 hypothetical protein SAICODRAFT_28367 [Saitoella complicata NRRL Y-17804]GAO49422.1 hypothetical protein G7K_3572-t1 [Saitoella complicata NRRL Y-17804]
MSIRRSSRPTTPLRRVQRGSFSELSRNESSATFPLDAMEPAFAEVSDALSDLHINLEQLQGMHESLAKFSESFASFLYGLNMNAFCVDFPEAPVPESFKRAEQEAALQRQVAAAAPPSSFRHPDSDQTFMTNETSFVEEPPARSQTSRQAPTKAGPGAGTSRGRGTARGTGRGASATRGSGIGRGRGRGM